MIKDIKQLFKVINPLERMANTEGMNQCFQILKSKYPELIIHKFNTKFKAGDWTVPRRWKLKYSFLKEGKKIITSSKICHLFVSPNSIAVDKILSGKEVKKRTISSKDFPNDYLLNHKHTYNYKLRHKEWGLSLPFNIFKKIKNNNKYHVSINANLTDEPLQAGELFIKGKVDKIISISAHIDELCNDNLSGSIAALKLYEKIKKKNNYFSYQIILFPELYGPIFFFKKFPEKTKKIIFTLNLETVGAGKEWCLKKAQKSNTFLEKCLIESFKKNKTKFKEIDFFQGFINDEKFYAWPNISIPGVAIQRYPYKYYHTSADTIDKINFKFILKSISIAYDMLNIFEKNFRIIKKNYIPKIISAYPPWLTKKNLYIAGKNSLFPFDEGNNLYNEKLLHSIDGHKTLFSICNSLNIDFNLAFNYIEKFVKKKIIIKKKISIKEMLY